MNDKRKEYLKKWREDNKERIKNYKKEYAKTHDSSFRKLQDKYKQLQQDNEILKEKLEEYKNPIKYFKYANKNVTEENKQLKDLIDTILNFSFFKEECPLNFKFEDNSKEDKVQNIFYNDEYCENNCNDIYKDCWLKYFKELQKAKGDVKNKSK